MIITTLNRPKGTIQDTAALIRERSDVAPDIIVVQECMRPAADSPTIAWDSWLETKGYGIAVREGWTACNGPLLQCTSARPFVVDTGEGLIHILNVWSHPDPSYVHGVLNAIAEARNFLSGGPSIVLGDFNGNPIFDKGGILFSSVVDALHDLGLASAYHHVHGLTHGHEPHPTYYHQWKEEQPFHIDYCFMPPSWLEGASVDVGTFAEWEGVSDHRPVRVATT